MDNKTFVKCLRKDARILKKPFEEWPEDFETDVTAFSLEWAAELIARYVPAEIPPKKIRRKKRVADI